MDVRFSALETGKHTRDTRQLMMNRIARCVCVDTKMEMERKETKNGRWDLLLITFSFY